MERPGSLLELAESLLKSSFTGDQSVSRVNVINARGGQGHALEPQRRRVAEGWQLLEHAGLICRDPDDRRGDGWFLTGAGRTALSGGDVQGSIILRVPGL